MPEYFFCLEEAFITVEKKLKAGTLVVATKTKGGNLTMDSISENGTSFRNGDGGVVNFVWGDDDAGLWNGSLGSSGAV